MPDQRVDLLHALRLPDDVETGGVFGVDHAAQAPVFVLQGKDMDRLGDEFRHGGEHCQFPVHFRNVRCRFVGRQDAHHPRIIDDGDTQEGQFVPVRQVPARPGAVQEEGLLPQARDGDGSTRLGHLAGDSLAGPVGNVHALQIDPVGHLQHRFTGVPVQKRDHPPLHAEPVAHLAENLLELVPQVPRLRQGLGNGMKGRQFFEGVIAHMEQN